MNETEAIALWRRMHSKDVILKIHGGRFQSCLPDLIHVSGRDGAVAFLEVKSVPGTTLPWSKCRLDQHLMLQKLARTGAEARYLVWSNGHKAFYLVDPMKVVEEETYQLKDAEVRYEQGPVN